MSNLRNGHVALSIVGICTHMEGRGPALEVRPRVAWSGQGVVAVVPAPNAISLMGKARDLTLGRRCTQH